MSISHLTPPPEDAAAALDGTSISLTTDHNPADPTERSAASLPSHKLAIVLKHVLSVFSLSLLCALQVDLRSCRNRIEASGGMVGCDKLQVCL